MRARKILVAVLAAVLVVPLLVLVAPAAEAGSGFSGSRENPGKIPDGTRDIWINAGRIKAGTVAPLELYLYSNDQPPECNDAVDNESGSVVSATQGPGAGTGPATDGLIDFGAAGGNETGLTGCVDATDNSELIHRETVVPNFGPCATGGPNATGCSGVDASGNGCFQCNWSANWFGDGSRTGAGTGTGQAQVDGGVLSTTISGSSISASSANLRLGNAYLLQGSCVTSPVTVCLNLYVQMRIVPDLAITGTANSDGSGTVSMGFDLIVRLNKTYDSGRVNILFLGEQTPYWVECQIQNVRPTITTETDGSLTGVRYDTFAQNVKMVDGTLNIPAPVHTGGSGGNQAAACDTLRDEIGLPDSNGEIELVITDTKTSAAPADPASNSNGGSDSGRGISGGEFRPVAVISSSLGSDHKTSFSLNVNEGDVVDLSSRLSYHPGMSVFESIALQRTAGPAPAAIAGDCAQSTCRFVAPDAPSGGTSQTWTATVQTWAGPCTTTARPPSDPNPTCSSASDEQYQQDTNTATVNIANVAPTADAGPDLVVTGGVPFTLSGSSTDPGDPDVVPTSRGYCWTETGGSLAGSTPNPPACSGSPSNNGKNVTITPANPSSGFETSGALTYSLVVQDNDGGTSVADTVSVTVRRQTSATMLKGRVTDGSTSSGLSGATVTAIDANGACASGTTAATGNYVFDASACALPFHVRFTASGYQTLYWSDASTLALAKKKPENQIASLPQGAVDQTLWPTASTGSISVDVQNTGGVSQVGEQVRVYDEHGFVGQGFTASPAVISGLQPKATYKVRVVNSPNGLASMWYAPTLGGALTGNRAALVTVNQSATTNLVFQVPAAGSGLGGISGTVLAGGSPVQNVEVRVYNASTGQWVKSACTDASGNYAIGAMPPANYIVWAWANYAQSASHCSNAVPPGLTSQWYNGLTGDQYDMTGKIATQVTVTGGATTTGIDFNL